MRGYRIAILIGTCLPGTGARSGQTRGSGRRWGDHRRGRRVGGGGLSRPRRGAQDPDLRGLASSAVGRFNEDLHRGLLSVASLLSGGADQRKTRLFGSSGCSWAYRFWLDPPCFLHREP